MDMLRPVKMCVCAGVTFDQLKRAGVTTLQRARDEFGCSRECGSCTPYILKMIETGEVAFPVLSDIVERIG